MTKMPLNRPIHFAFSYDEEAGCRGMPHMIRQMGKLCASPLGAIIGEPSGMVGIRGHKGKAAARLEIYGTTGHSSRPEKGLNAIHGITTVMNAAMKTIDTLQDGPFDQNFEPPYSTLRSLASGFTGGGNGRFY